MMDGRYPIAIVLGIASTMSHAGAEDGCFCDLPALPIAVSNNAVTSVANDDGTTTLYSFMGITDPDDSGSITAAAHRLDFPGGEWQRIADAPLLNGLARIGANAISVAGEVYLMGGYSVAGFSETTDWRLFRYEPDDDSYVELASVPAEVDDTVLGVYDDRYIYAVSGWHGPIFDNVANVQVYDTQTDQWQQATPIEAPLPGLFGHAGSIIGDRIFYMDGVISIGGFPITDRVFIGTIDSEKIGDVLSITWTELDPHPGEETYRGAASQTATSDGRMLLVGGTDNPYNFDGIGYNGQRSFPLDQVLAFDPIGESWTELAISGAHAPTMDHRGLVQVGAGFAVVGGMDGPGFTTSAVSLLRIDPITCAADLNNDGIVGTVDLLELLGAWGDCRDCKQCPADLDSDCTVGATDLIALLGRWGY